MAFYLNLEKLGKSEGQHFLTLVERPLDTFMKFTQYSIPYRLGLAG